MVEDIDLRHLDSMWLDHIESAALTTLESVNEQATKSKVTKEQAALATMAEGSYIYTIWLKSTN